MSMDCAWLNRPNDEGGSIEEVWLGDWGGEDEELGLGHFHQSKTHTRGKSMQRAFEISITRSLKYWQLEFLFADRFHFPK